MKRKIETIVYNCNQCRFSSIYENKIGNQALICEGIEIDNGETTPSFLILNDHRVNDYRIEIPDNCPLEDYNEKE